MYCIDRRILWDAGMVMFSCISLHVLVGLRQREVSVFEFKPKVDSNLLSSCCLLTNFCFCGVIWYRTNQYLVNHFQRLDYFPLPSKKSKLLASCTRFLFFFFSSMPTIVEMPQASTDPFRCYRDPDNLNNFFDIVDQGIVASNSQIFSVDSSCMSAESLKVMMPEAERNYFTCLCLIKYLIVKKSKKIQ